jgi:hypothetical protein
MFSNFDRLDIPIKLPASHPQFLEGLDRLLELGLISDIEVKFLCQNYLTCKLTLQPQMAVAQVQKAISEDIIVPPVPVEALIAVDDKPQPRQKADNALARVMRSLVAELSVRWLLFLGIFLVVMSSGLLAASQWQRFPAAGQYGVLLTYTLSFFAVSFWSGKQPNLKLTTQALLIVALLLVPVNFWAIDEFSLWQNPLSWIVIVFAFVSLTTITVLIANSKLFVTNLPNRNLRVLNILGLSYLHLGWKISAFPLIAIYIAIIGTSCLTLYQKALVGTKQGNQDEFSINLPASTIVYALGLLLSRAIFINHIDITLLGLAIGICGWLVGYGNGEWRVGSREWGIEGVEKVEEIKKHSLSTSPTPYSLLPNPYLLGTLLLCLGWVVSVLPHPAQALAVSGLGLWVISQRLQLYSLKRDFAAIFLVGLQANLLVWRLVPAGFQNKIVAIASQLTYSQNESWVLWSLGLFPYLVATVAFAEYLRSSGKANLGKFGETIYLGFGTVLTTIALVSPGVRSLNLLASTITLASIYQFRLKNSSTPPHLIYLTHITIILTLCSFINWQLPTLRPEYWATILLILMVVEWLFSLGAGIWRRSAWYMGFPLACISFALLWGDGYGYFYLKQGHWGAIWLVTPMTLTAIASRSTNTSRKINSLSAVLALGVAQLLTLPLPKTRLVALGVAAVLMLINTGYLQHEQYAVITIGFVLAFIGFAFWEGVPGLPMLSVSGWFVVGAVTILSLWVTRRYLLHKSVDEESLQEIYAEAANKWACVLLAGELLALTIHSVLVYQSIATPGIFYILATAITLGAILFHSWHLPRNWSFYCIGWCLELLAAESLAFGEKTIIRVAIANIALGLATQIFGEFWRRKHRQEKLPNSFHILPIIYGAFSLVLRSQTFAAWTGLLTLSVALILIGIGRRHKDLKPLTYIGLVGVSVSAYEMLFYQMLQKTGGAYGDGLIAMSALGAGIMYAYRILSPWLIKYLQLTALEIRVVANFHWAWSSLLLLTAIVSPIGINRFVGIGTGVFLVRYAIFQGRNSITPSSPPTPSSSDIWVYLGIIEAACVSIFLQNLPIGRILTQQLLPWNAAISCVAACLLYILPWERWGWSKKPWRNIAYILPIVILWITWAHVHILALLITAGFYAFLAKANQNFQFTYITVILIDWALFRWFGDLRLTDGLWYVAPIGLSLLYVAQFGSQIKQPQLKPSRHFLRLLGSGLICGFALVFHQDTAIIPGILSLVTIFAGLAFRIRAFLYVGTGTFLITGIYQLVIFSLRYPFLKWIIGLLVGIILISIAANFETRREQVISLLRNTGGDFHEWE